ncbi:hypothetical protein GCM10023178_26620 [Actinomadura luteofluorescens]
MRRFPSYRGQRNYPGLYYAAMLDAHVETSRGWRAMRRWCWTTTQTSSVSPPNRSGESLSRGIPWGREPLPPEACGAPTPGGATSSPAGNRGSRRVPCVREAHGSGGLSKVAITAQ